MRKIARLFVCAGAQKSGTTWLHEQFASQPEFGVPFSKEIHYFDHVHCGTRYLNDVRLRTLMWHMAHKPEELAHWMHGDHPNKGSHEVGVVLDAATQRLNDDWYVNVMSTNARWAIDFSPGYATIGRVGFEHMRGLAHELEICFVMRHPAERAWSSLVHELRDGGLKEVHPDSEHLSEAEVTKLLCDESSMIQRYTDYWATLQSLDQVFGLDHTTLAFFDEIKTAPEALLSRLFAKLQVDPGSLDRERLARKVFESPRIGMPDYARRILQARWAPMVRRIDKEVCRVPEAWRLDFGLGRSRGT